MRSLSIYKKRVHWDFQTRAPSTKSRKQFPYIRQSRHLIGQLCSSFPTQSLAYRSQSNSYSMGTNSEPTAEGATALFKELEKKFPTQTLGEERWYLIAVCLPPNFTPLGQVQSEIRMLLNAEPIRSQPSQEAARPSLLGVYTRISPNSRNTQPLNLDKSLFAD